MRPTDSSTPTTTSPRPLPISPTAARCSGDEPSARRAPGLVRVVVPPQGSEPDPFLQGKGEGPTAGGGQRGLAATSTRDDGRAGRKESHIGRRVAGSRP